MDSIYNAVIVLLIGVNLNSFALMGLDKRRAKKHGWRIPEKTLFLCALPFGGLGAVLGMRIFRHKTKHWYFAVGMPLILLAQLVLLGILIKIIKS